MRQGDIEDRVVDALHEALSVSRRALRSDRHECLAQRRMALPNFTENRLGAVGPHGGVNIAAPLVGLANEISPKRRSSGRLAASAETGYCHRQIGACGGEVRTLAD